MSNPDVTTLTRKDFVSDQDVRWCPGCGDYAILASVLGVLPKLGVKKEDVVFISGIGCSSRFPYYADTFGFHTIHGRGPAVVTGLRVANPNLSAWLVTGDGDGLSIGGNHLMHLLRRNVDVNVLLFNNQIYGLTKGQYSPTSEVGLKTKTSPMGAIDAPLQPGAFAAGCAASFIARCTDVQVKEMGAVIERSAAHHGTSFVEILQNCVIFNDGTFKGVTDKEVRKDRQLWVEHGKPLIFGDENEKGIRFVDGKPEILDLRADDCSEADCTIHDETADPAYAMALSRLGLDGDDHFPVAMGILRAVERPVFEAKVHGQIAEAQAVRPDQDLSDLYRGFGKVSTWEVDAGGQTVG